MADERWMTDKQILALAKLSMRYGVPFNSKAFAPAFDLPDGWVSGWIGENKLYVGCSPEGEISS